MQVGLTVRVSMVVAPLHSYPKIIFKSTESTYNIFFYYSREIRPSRATPEARRGASELLGRRDRRDRQLHEQRRQERKVGIHPGRWRVCPRRSRTQLKANSLNFMPTIITSFLQANAKSPT